jgi:hypothetical protein
MLEHIFKGLVNLFKTALITFGAVMVVGILVVGLLIGMCL